MESAKDTAEKADTAGTAKGGAEASWKRRFGLFLGSQALSIFGSMLVQYAILWDITLTAKSGSAQTLYILFGMLPTFLLSPFGGVWADRHDRKLLIAGADAATAAATLVLALVFLAGRESLPLLLGAAAVRALGQAVQGPAVGAFLPQIVPPDKLTQANAASSAIQSGIMLISPMAAGALMTFAPVETIFFIDVGTAALAVSILLFLLKTEPIGRSAERRAVGYFRDLKEGIAYQRSHPYLRRFFLFSTLFFVLIAPAAMLTPLQVVRSFGEEVWRLTAIEIAFSAGMMGGGALAGIWKGFKNRVHTMALATGLFGITTLGLGLVPWFWLYLALMAGCGLSVPLYNTPAVVILQERVEPEQLGRVFGVMTMISSAAMPLAMLFFGPLADVLRIEVLLIFTGGLIGLLSFFLLGSKTLVEAGRRGELRAA